MFTAPKELEIPVAIFGRSIFFFWGGGGGGGGGGGVATFGNFKHPPFLDVSFLGRFISEGCYFQNFYGNVAKE